MALTLSEQRELERQLRSNTYGIGAAVANGGMPPPNLGTYGNMPLNNFVSDRAVSSLANGRIPGPNLGSSSGSSSAYNTLLKNQGDMQTAMLKSKTEQAIAPLRFADNMEEADIKDRLSDPGSDLFSYNGPSVDVSVGDVIKGVGPASPESLPAGARLANGNAYLPPPPVKSSFDLMKDNPRTLNETGRTALASIGGKMPSTIPAPPPGLSDAVLTRGGSFNPTTGAYTLYGPGGQRGGSGGSRSQGTDQSFSDQAVDTLKALRQNQGEAFGSLLRGVAGVPLPPIQAPAFSQQSQMQPPSFSNEQPQQPPSLDAVIQQYQQMHPDRSEQEIVQAMSSSTDPQIRAILANAGMVLR